MGICRPVSSRGQVFLVPVRVAATLPVGATFQRHFLDFAAARKAAVSHFGAGRGAVSLDGLRGVSISARTPAMTRSSLPRGLSALILGAGLSLSGAAFGHAPTPGGAPMSHAAPAASVSPEDDYGDDIQGNVPGASAIEGRLMAPCCWVQTIDIHDSPVALSMRHEIRRRLRNGESAEVIQASFVERYGSKIMAVQESSQLKNVFIGLSVVMGGAGIAAAMMIGRWRKQSALRDASKPKDAPEPKRDQWDEKLDAELKELDKE